MRSQLTFLAATLAAGYCLLYSAVTAQEFPTVLQSVWPASATLSYDPLLAATFLLAMTLAVGRTVDAVCEEEHRDGSYWIQARAARMGRGTAK